MATRFYDVPIHTFSPWCDIAVVCPQCGGAGTVRFDRERHTAFFRCASCHAVRAVQPGERGVRKVTARCSVTGKRFQVFVPEQKIRGPRHRVRCPYCGERVVGDTAPGLRTGCVVLEDIRRAEDPYFHYPLYFQAPFRGKTVWALNRAHLQYLIDYLSAGLRTVPPGYHSAQNTMRTQSDMLPAFMKSAKNRAALVKLLTRLRDGHCGAPPPPSKCNFKGK